jgi:apolipoprotein N-acyltransferase
MSRTALLLAAALVLPLANGVNSIAIAAFLAPLLVLRFVRTSRPLPGLLATFVLQTVAFAVQFRGMIPAPGAVLAIIIPLYGLGLTAPYIADRWLAPRLSRWPATLIFPCAWAATESLVSLLPYGSWGSAAYSLYGSLPLLQVLAVTGLWGVTFLIGWIAAIGNHAWELADAPAKALRTVGVAASVLAAIALGGGARLALFPPPAPTVRIASLSRMELSLHPDPRVLSRFYSQRSLTANELSTIRARAATISDDLLARTESEASAGARIVFWGEANAPVVAEDEAALIQQGAATARRSGIYLGMGLAGWHRDTVPQLANKLVLLAPDGTVAWEFYKAHPIPGSEAAMSITRDGKLQLLETPYGRLTSVICFDADSPQLLAQAGKLRADIVLDPSNDWKAIDPWHTQMASFRAIEQGVSIVRQASYGLSAAFDYQGHVLASMDHYLATDHVMVSQVPTHGVRTLYAMFGDWFAWMCLAMLAALTTWRGLRSPVPRT